MDGGRKPRSAIRRPTLIAAVLILVVGLGMHARREYYRQLALGCRGRIASELRSGDLQRPGRGDFSRPGWIRYQRAMMRESERIADDPWLPFRQPDRRKYETGGRPPRN